MSASGSGAVLSPPVLRRGGDPYQTRRTLLFSDGPKSATSDNDDDAGNLDEPGLHFHFPSRKMFHHGVSTSSISLMESPRTVNPEKQNLVIERLDNIFATLKLVTIRLDTIDARLDQDRVRMDCMETRMGKELRVAAGSESPRKNEEKAASAKTTPIQLARTEGFRAVKQMQPKVVSQLALA